MYVHTHKEVLLRNCMVGEYCFCICAKTVLPTYFLPCTSRNVFVSMLLCKMRLDNCAYRTVHNIYGEGNGFLVPVVIFNSPKFLSFF